MTKTTFKILDGAKAIDTAIKSIGTRGAKLQSDIHVAAVSTLVHADKHGDVTLAQNLVDAVPTLARKNALRDWFIAMGKFSYDTTEKTLTFNKKGTTLLDTAIATPFWEFKQEAEYVPFDLQAAILTLVKRADKAMQNGDKVDAAALKQLTAIATGTVKAVTKDVLAA